uniref:Nuclease associated modular domain-containing protein n=1 Tax=Rhizophora mucronata TaxID=61149 RepID=A0A2P2JM63_RHIMU
MPFLADAATAQASLQNHLGPRRAQSFIPRKVVTAPFTFCDDKNPRLPLRRSASLPGRSNARDSLRIHISAVATLEPKCLPHKEDGNNIFQNPLLDVNSHFSPAWVESSNLDWADLDDGEKLRRGRISKGNKGNIPWNKGRKHSAETLQRIRERTKLAMQNPKVMSCKSILCVPLA